MSKLLGERELAAPFAATTQLPLGWYFDQAIHQRELDTVFKHGPVYVGHELMVPNRNDYRALETRDGAWALVNNGQSIELVSNVCRHRQAVMLKGAGQLQGGNIVCPLHRWTYDNKGDFLGAPHFAEQPCLHLPRRSLSSWNGLLFEGPHPIVDDLAKIKWVKDLSFDGYVFDKAEVTEYNFNWKTFIEVYLEDYHVVPFHPGLGHFVDCNSLEWEFGNWYSVQVVGVNKALTQPGSETYKKWHDVVLGYRNGEPPPYGAIWLTVYPNVMVEWYPHVLVVSTIIPRGPDKCTNVVEFYYPEEIALFEREFVEAEQKAYAETAVEDEEICQRMNDGRRMLWNEGREEQGPYQTPYEDGMVHFHEFMRRELATE
ncbi:MAG: aromatic ring-hydroxylating oxygenase subunit alpha [Burkholderiales bacterium]